MGLFTTLLSSGVGVIGSILGGKKLEEGARKAEAAQTEALRGAEKFQKRGFRKTEAGLQPFADVGQEALQTLSGLLGLPGGEGAAGLGEGEFGAFRRQFTGQNLQDDPGLAFRRQQGTEALERSAAARGGLLSGRTGVELERFGQEFGSQEFSRAFDRFRSQQSDLFSRLGGLADVGRGAETTIGGFRGQLGQDVAGLRAGVGQAQAASELAKSQAQANKIGGVTGALQGGLGNISFLQQVKDTPTGGLTGGAPAGGLQLFGTGGGEFANPGLRGSRNQFGLTF